jgi:hypothetical protein
MLHLNQTVTLVWAFLGYSKNMMMNSTQANSYYDNYDGSEPFVAFRPTDFIAVQQDGFAICSNPMADGGLSAITVNTKLIGEPRRNFEASVKRMVLAKLFSPKFAEVILTATRPNPPH